MKLFPASASPAALSQVVYDAWKTQPTLAEQREIDDDDRRHERCTELCAESFDTADANAVEWLMEHPDDVFEIACAAIRGNDDDLRAAITRLRDRYLDARAESYAEQVRDEEQRHREDADYDAWEDA